MYNHKCYRVVFSDGTSIVADADHLWETTTYVPWLKTTVKTTEEIKNSLYYQKGYNHQIKLAKPIQYSYKELPIEPYTFGVWLGDGASNKANITCHVNDLDIREYVALEGYPVRPVKYRDRTGGFVITDSVKDRTKDCLVKRLRELGVYENKHIPDIYLQSSIEQRFELLRGLMDTDGTITKAGQCSFTTTIRQLAEQVFELIASLGFKPTIRERSISLNGKRCKNAFYIDFWAYDDTPVFKLKRKLERQKKKPDSETRASFRKIVDVQEVESVPVKCIQVDNESKLYLAGKSFIPTHNTSLIGALSLYHLVCDPPGGQIYCCAADRGQAELVYKAALGMIEQEPEFDGILKVLDSRKEIKNLHTGTILKVLSAEAYTNHGINPTVGIFDELHAQPNRDLWDVMTVGAGAARKEPLWWVNTTAGDDPDRNSIGWEIHEYARKVRDGEINDPHWYVKIYGIPEDAEDIDIFDEKLWYEVNPSLGHTISIESLRQEALLARNSEAARSEE